MECPDRKNFLTKVMIKLGLVKYYNLPKKVTLVPLSKRPSANILSVLKYKKNGMDSTILHLINPIRNL